MAWERISLWLEPFISALLLACHMFLSSALLYLNSVVHWHWTTGEVSSFLLIYYEALVYSPNTWKESRVWHRLFEISSCVAYPMVATAINVEHTEQLIRSPMDRLTINAFMLVLNVLEKVYWMIIRISLPGKGLWYVWKLKFSKTPTNPGSQSCCTSNKSLHI